MVHNEIEKSYLIVHTSDGSFALAGQKEKPLQCSGFL